MPTHACAATPAAVGDVRLKLALARDGAVWQRRRVRVAGGSFAAVRGAVERCVAGRYVVSYVDDEGDAVVVGGEDEWAECVAVVAGGGAGRVSLTVETLDEEGGPGGAVWGGAAAPVAAAGTTAVEVEASVSPPASAVLKDANNAPPVVDTPARVADDNAAAVPQPCATAGCGYAQTGVAAGYCCVMCQKNPGRHGLRCMKRGVVDGAACAAPPAVAEGTDNAPPAAGAADATPPVVDADAAVVEQIAAMGFPADDSLRALVTVCNGEAAAVLERLLTV